MIPKIIALSGLIYLLGVVSVRGQEVAKAGTDSAYIQVVTERAAKIVAPLELTSPSVKARVQERIARQYRDLNTLHESRKEAIKNRKETASTSELENEKKRIEAGINEQLTRLHVAFLADLSADLTHPQIDQVKDGMTYGVLPITYKGYQAMLPDLTDEQKKQVLAYLTEARERAMDEGSSKEKHAMFGKYKGRINNYLSASGIDMKKASKAWEERIARDALKTNE
ncbi:DUF3826 domain-containing protein [Larkinella terrae]|uniref:DUF3826 domain-containing protein n=1 Tax=Larkinella terrae TaxID=2025311 RepID=A0A7K0ESV4_9BACT|nr:DUF3826 domain-containing protein [Larkinella terrae]MRS64601.1 DUF3826 domain-containing protein [Larkinella terrae]